MRVVCIRCLWHKELRIHRHGVANDGRIVHYRHDVAFNIHTRGDSTIPAPRASGGTPRAPYAEAFTLPPSILGSINVPKSVRVSVPGRQDAESRIICVMTPCGRL